MNTVCIQNSPIVPSETMKIVAAEPAMRGLTSEELSEVGGGGWFNNVKGWVHDHVHLKIDAQVSVGGGIDI